MDGSDSHVRRRFTAMDRHIVRFRKGQRFCFL